MCQVDKYKDFDDSDSHNGLALIETIGIVKNIIEIGEELSELRLKNVLEPERAGILMWAIGSD